MSDLFTDIHSGYIVDILCRYLHSIQQLTTVTRKTAVRPSGRTALHDKMLHDSEGQRAHSNQVGHPVILLLLHKLLGEYSVRDAQKYRV